MGVESKDMYRKKHTIGSVVMDVAMSVLMVMAAVVIAVFLAGAWFVIMGASLLGAIF